MKNENPFKQKLYHHTLPVSDDLWNRIELQLPVARKRFPFLFFALASVVVLAGAILLWAVIDAPTQMNTPAPEKKTIPAVPANLEESVHEVSLNSNPENQTSSIHVNNSPINSATGISTTKTGAKSKISSSGNNLDVKENNFITKSNEVISSNLNSTLQHDIFTVRSSTFQTTTSLPFGGVGVIPANEVSTGILSIRPDPSCYKFTGQETQSNLSVDFFAGPGFSPRTFKPTSVESVLYSEARSATEKGRYAWSGGARVNLKLNHELAVRLGITYEHIGDVFDYTDTLATKQSTQIDSFFAADGTFLYTETNTILIFGTLIKKIHNRYHRLDIPLLASYELPMGRATLMVNAGPVINLVSSARGQILDPMLVPQYITAGAQNQLKAYKNSLGLSVYLGAGALIPINKYFSGLIEPRFIYRIKPVTIDSYPIKELRHTGGINLGIRYHFD